MDGKVAFSILSLFSVLSTDSPLSPDRSVKAVLKFDFTLLTTVLATIVVWVGISRIGTLIFIPIYPVLAVLLTLSGIAVTLVVMYMLISRVIDGVEQHISKALNERHLKPEWDNTRKPLRH